MAHGENAKRSEGKEWWGKRPLSYLGVNRKGGMKLWKRLLHKIERAQGKNKIRKNNIQNEL